jgi:putrescine aminotransferase
VALANLKLLQREKLIDRIKNDIGPYLARGWSKLGEHPLVGEARMVGLLGALELVKVKEPMQRFDEKQGVGTICRDFLVQNGLVMRAVGDTIVAAPPFVLSHDEADEMMEITWKCLDLTSDAISG